LFSDDLDLSTAYWTYNYQYINASGTIVQDIAKSSSDLISLGPDVIALPAFSDSLAALDAYVAAKPLETQYDQTAYECIAAFEYGTVDGNSVITFQSDCEVVSVAMIFPGDWANTEFLTNSAESDSCQNMTSYLYCSALIMNGGKFGIMS